MQRIDESKSIYKSVLSKPFDYKADESFNTDYEKMPYAKNATELNERWRKQIKLSTLSKRRSIIKILSEIFDPPMIAVNGRSEYSRIFCALSNSACITYPLTLSVKNCPITAVEACAR